jgi:hypothetical protein
MPMAKGIALHKISLENICCDTWRVSGGCSPGIAWRWGAAGERKNKNKTDPGQFGKRKTEMQRGFFLCLVSVRPNTVQILSEVFSFCAVGFRSRFVVVVRIAHPQRLCSRVSSSPPPTPATLLFFLCLI